MPLCNGKSGTRYGSPLDGFSFDVGGSVSVPTPIDNTLDTGRSSLPLAFPAMGVALSGG